MYDKSEPFDGWEPSLTEDTDEIEAIIAEELGDI